MTATPPVLDILVCDTDTKTDPILMRYLDTVMAVGRTTLVASLAEATRDVVADHNVIFLDPVRLGLAETTEFVDRTRENWPGTAFVLFLDVAAAEAQADVFYEGDRERFTHYYRLDKGTPFRALVTEVDNLLDRCRTYVSTRRFRHEIRSVTRAIEELTPDSDAREAISILAERLNAIFGLTAHSSGRPMVRKNSVFLSYRFEETEYVLDGLIPLLEEKGFEVLTGESTPTYISTSILQRIREAEFFLSVLTRNEEKADGTFTTSPWLLEEKGAALAFGKYVVLLVEEGVTDYGALEGDWRHHRFTPKAFLAAARKAVAQLQSASGAGHVNRAARA